MPRPAWKVILPLAVRRENFAEPYERVLSQTQIRPEKKRSAESGTRTAGVRDGYRGRRSCDESGRLWRPTPNRNSRRELE